MNHLETVALPRHLLTTRLLREITQSDVIMLSGPSQSGRSHTLRELAEHLEASEFTPCLIQDNSHDSVARLKQATTKHIVLFDGLENATSELLHALANQVAAGTVCVGAINTDSAAKAYHDFASELVASGHPAVPRVTQSKVFRIEPLGRHEAEQIVKVSQRMPLDSVTINAVIAMAWGRPGWLLELIELAEAGKVRADPHPSISEIDTGDLYLSTFHFAVQAAERHLTPESIAAAVALSKLEPRTLQGASELIGTQCVAELREAGVMIETPHDAQLFNVPELLSAPLSLLADRRLLARAGQLAAEKLLAQEALGIPLPDREVVYCAWNFTAGPEPLPTQTPHHQVIADAHARLVGELTADLVRFGRQESRDLLLRASTTEVFNEFMRVRAAAVFRGPTEALRLLHGVAPGSPQHPDSDVAAATSATRQHKIEFLRTQLLAQLGALETRTRTGDLNPEQTDFDRVATVFARWNDVDPLGTDLEPIFHAAQSHTNDEVALLAEQLLVLESARAGTWLPEGLTPHSQSSNSSEAAQLLRSRISVLALNSERALHDQLIAAAVAEGTIAMLTATHLSTMQAIAETVQNLPGAPFHRLWVQHLSSAAIAVAAGDTARAAREWTGFEQRLPQFLPIRLQRVIALIGAELKDPAHTPAELRKPTHHMLDYLRGALDTVRVPGLTPDGKESSPGGTSNTLPVFCLAAAHLGALRAQNPVVLMRTAEQLQRLGLWAPAVYALQEAQTIFVRRRASGGVARCTALLHEIETAARQHAPWFEIVALTPAPRSRLTKRETDVAQLAAHGLSNREVAERLSCSVRTVESHLAAARAKLGAASRADLAARLGELGQL